LPASTALATVRISLGRCNSALEVDEFVRTVSDIAADLAVRTA